MSDRVRCKCQRCSVRGLTGPVVVITVGVLFLLQQMSHSDGLEFAKTYPFILIVIGMVSLATSFASTEGHISSEEIRPMPPGAAAPPVPPTPTPDSGQGQ